MSGLRELPRQAWTWIWRSAALILAVATLASVVISELVLQSMSHGLDGPEFLVSVAMPTLLGSPVLLFCLIRQQQLKLANQKLHMLATTDWLTECLNRRAFTQHVSTHLEKADAGALLVIDADHFKLINDRHGHDRGDEALILLVDTIQQILRPGDLLGRLGGEEFGVFLPGCDKPTAALLAERIRHGIAQAGVGPDLQLSVSIGGAYYAGATTFSTLFRQADEQLYIAKQGGRNRVALAGVSSLLPEVERPGTQAAA